MGRSPRQTRAQTARSPSASAIVRAASFCATTTPAGLAGLANTATPSSGRPDGAIGSYGGLIAAQERFP